jgi:hypothetical protein
MVINRFIPIVPLLSPCNPLIAKGYPTTTILKASKRFEMIGSIEV